MTAVEAIAATAGIFTFCVAGLKVISRSRDSPEHMLHFSAKLDLQIARLILWGRNAGLANYDLAADLEPVLPQLMNMFRALSLSLQNARQLQQKYGIKMVDEPSELSLKGTPALRRQDSLQSVDFLETPDGVIGEEVVERRIEKQTSVFQKTKWAILDGAKAEGFLEEIKGYVNGLNELMIESRLPAPGCGVRMRPRGRPRDESNWDERWRNAQRGSPFDDELRLRPVAAGSYLRPPGELSDVPSERTRLSPPSSDRDRLGERGRKYTSDDKERNPRYRRHASAESSREEKRGHEYRSYSGERDY
jgi:hypothetical protein